MSNSKELPSDFIISKGLFDSLNHGLSGALGACCTTMILYPVENVKTRIQSLIKARTQETEEQQESDKEKPKVTIMDIVKKVYDEEGAKGFYKGIVPYICGILSSFGAYFFWYEFFRQRFLSTGFSATGYIKSALLAGMITAVVTNPVWVVHTRVILEKKKADISILGALKKILKTEGFSGLFKGTQAGCILVANPIIQFVVYEFLKKKFEDSKYKALVYFLSGAISKAIATYMTYPYQTLKTILQANEKDNVSLAKNISSIYQQYGIAGFYRGLSAKLSQTVINSALLLVFYENIHRFIEVLQLMHI